MLKGVSGKLKGVPGKVLESKPLVGPQWHRGSPFQRSTFSLYLLSQMWSTVVRKCYTNKFFQCLFKSVPKDEDSGRHSIGNPTLCPKNNPSL